MFLLYGNILFVVSRSPTYFIQYCSLSNNIHEKDAEFSTREILYCILLLIKHSFIGYDIKNLTHLTGFCCFLFYIFNYLEHLNHKLNIEYSHDLNLLIKDGVSEQLPHCT